ncbi:ATP-dependent DNA helicase RecG [Prochlorococcus sp. MIT 1223]|uniref:ATP-dependent DNA helicase RecG n=1 Tax=Prochlorococcus sp. MIT 1223 TaxID=3096217 RepID=UPI002A752D88|nr:ATP-dependent DNA helicase RecG [Prochlorococcus sp. MIT 1223]
MVEETPKFQQSNHNKGLTDKEVGLFQAWTRLLQKALTLEVENDFKNLQGRNELFNAFISRQLKAFPAFLSKDSIARLQEFEKGFNGYPSLPEPRKRRLVIDLRHQLHRLLKKYDYEPKTTSINLKIRNPHSFEKNVSNTPENVLNLDSEIIDIHGIGEKRAQKLCALGLYLVRDIFLHYPRDYVDYSSLRKIRELEVGDTATIVATVRKCNSFVSPRNKNLSILDIQLQDISGRIKVTRFFAGRRFSNRSYLKSQEQLYPVGSRVAVSGLVKEGPYGKSFNDPIIEVLESTSSEIKSKTIGRLIPIYSLSEGITSEYFREIIYKILPLSNSWIDPVPSEIIRSISLPIKSKALIDIHCPTDQEALDKARRRLVFDEFFALQLSLLLRRSKLKNRPSPYLPATCSRDGLPSLFLNSLPFALTKSQQRVLVDIERDLSKFEPMSRLLQGDVGSGKTIVAVAALLRVIQGGCQGALMAPTEVLAEQHYRNLCKWLPQLHVNVELLTGSTTRKHRRQILDDLAAGTLQLLVGTHALLEDPVTFARLGLVVVDEQHRFGVRQRNLLLDKGLQPHLLTMTATPIPRTLALSLHGDLDVSQIDELPPGRTPVDTQLYSRGEIDDVYKLIRNEVTLGHQAYVVLPLVDDSQKLQLRSAIKVHEELEKDIFPDLQVGLLHGRMSGSDKQEIIRKFISREFDILVSTTVVEVGVDIPNATVMVIDNADRFGLSQLHQLRGRVGRGASKSFCLLIYDGKQQSSKHRLEVLVSSNDGFEISEIDLRLRGPGQVLGTKQSGLPDFALASLITDADILELARQKATDLLVIDPELRKHAFLSSWIKNQFHVSSINSHLN